MYFIDDTQGDPPVSQVTIFILSKKAGTLYFVYRREELLALHFFKEESLSKDCWGPLLK